MIRLITDTGLEEVPTFDNGPMIPDFVRYRIENYQSEPVKGHTRDIAAYVAGNRDYHYPRIKRTVDELHDRLAGKKVVLLCPGPSAARLPIWPIPDDVVVIAVNSALRMGPPTLCFITERHARLEWVQKDNGDLLDHIPETPLITCPDASKWVADLWPDEDRYYCIMPWGEFPQDPRSIPYVQSGLLRFSCVITPIIAIDCVQKAAPERIVLAGMDFSTDTEGNYYFDLHASQHPNGYSKNLAPGVGNFGKIVGVSPDLAAHAAIMKAACYWIERSARIPVLNASDGVLDWRPTPYEEALAGDFEPIVDDVSGDVMSK